MNKNSKNWKVESLLLDVGRGGRYTEVIKDDRSSGVLPFPQYLYNFEPGVWKDPRSHVKGGEELSSI